MDRQVHFDSTNERKKEEEREEGDILYLPSGRRQTGVGDEFDLKGKAPAGGYITYIMYVKTSNVARQNSCLFIPTFTIYIQE